MSQNTLKNNDQTIPRIVGEYEIENFKAIKKSGLLPIRPVTLLFGPNSSGKSSILQSLLLLKQKLQPQDELTDLGNFKEFIFGHESNNNFSFSLTLKKSSINNFFHRRRKSEYWNDTEVRYSGRIYSKKEIGVFLSSIDVAYYKVVFSYDEKEQKITPNRLELSISQFQPPFIFLPAGENIFQIYKDSCRGQLMAILAEQVSDFLTLENLQSDFNENGESVVIEILGECFCLEKYKDFINSTNWAELTLQQRLNVLFPDLPIDAEDNLINLGLKTQMYLSSNEIKGEESFKNALKRGVAKTLLVTDLYVHLVDSFYFIYGDSLQDIDDDEDKGIRSNNDHPIGKIFSALNYHMKALLDISYIQPLRDKPERYYFLNCKKKEYGALHRLYQNHKLLEKFNKELHKLKMAYELNFTRIVDEVSGVPIAFMPKLLNLKTGIVSSLRDVGFGISQILPIITESISSKDKTIVIEQPELHLHPALQAEMGDLFINSALGEQNNTFIIETHSEHLILRILRRIRQTANGELPEGIQPITPDLVSVICIKSGEEGSEVLHIPITEDGDFATDWPEGFFTEREEELF